MTAPTTTNSTFDAIRHSLDSRYVLERELGRGGMGTVYLAREVKLDRPVALKVLLPEFASQPGLRDRFLRETRTAASFSHPNIVPVYAVEEWEGHLAYAMGLVEGETLTERVARAGPLPVREIVRMVKDVAHALAYAHGRGVVHRDIKPDNVMLERATGRALVLDFGISRSMTHVPASTATNLTRVGEVVGTPEYMSPEQASGDVVDGRSDLYSLGLTVYYAATGRPAITGDNTQKILVRQLTERLTPIEQLRPDLPQALAAAVDRCVEKDPADRFATAEALVDEIDAAQLVEREIPLPIRLFAGELSSLLLAAFLLLATMWAGVETQLHANMTLLDTMLPVAGLLAILVTRVLTTMSEGRRLAVAGFSSGEVMDGMRRVMEEGKARRDELRADPETRRRRKATVIAAVVMLVGAIAMILAARAMRVQIGPRQYRSPIGAIVLVFSGFALFGTSWVLLLRSPFRMPPGERIFRLLWLGPIGRVFVRASMRGVRPSGTSARRSHHAVPAAPVVKAAEPAVAAPRAGDRIGALEARVAELERWRKSKSADR